MKLEKLYLACSVHSAFCQRRHELTIFMYYSWNKPDRTVVLASRSPRRKRLLAQMGVAFEAEHPRLDDEAAYFKMADLTESLQTLATAKATSVAVRHPEALVLGTDTVVVLDNEVLGKPTDRSEARHMLSRLSGREHAVHSGIALVCHACHFAQASIAQTMVRFRQLSDNEIDAYLDRNEYADKAGAYGIQGAAMVFVDGICGCYYNVVGLPVTATITLFRSYVSRGCQSNETR